MAKVFMVDDEPLLMESLEIILTYSGGHLISGTSNNGVEALEKLSLMAEEDLPDVMLADLNETFVYTKEEILSKAENSPYIGEELTGRVKLTIAGGSITYDELR